MYIVTLLYDLSKGNKNKIEKSNKKSILRNEKFLEESFLLKSNFIIYIKAAIKNNNVFQKIVYAKKSKKRKILVDVVRKNNIKLELKNC